MKLNEYLLELPFGHYREFNSIEEAVQYRESIKSNGNIWTIDGHLISEEYIDNLNNEISDKNLSRAMELVKLREHLTKRIPSLVCPRCIEFRQIQLKDHINVIIWKCRTCKYEWEELSWGKE